jgi:cobalamin biosynthesis protein CbiG
VSAPRFTVGVGASSAATAAEIHQLVTVALAEAGIDAEHVACVGTVTGRAADPGLVALGWPVIGYAPAVLAGVDVPSPASERARRELGTGSVAEAAALLAAGPGARIVLPRRRSRRATAAIATRPDGTPRPSPDAGGDTVP